MSRGSSRSTLRQLIMLLTMPLLLVSTTYALFNQELSINASGSGVSYVSNNYTLMTYNKTATQAGSTWTYSLSPVTIKNNGVTSITAWQVVFDIPSDAPMPTCASTVLCTKSGTKVTVKNGAGNGTLTAGGSTTFSLSFTTATAAYTLQNVVISATYDTAFQTIAGLSVTISNTGSKVKGIWTWTPTITVTNNSGQSLSGWQVTVTPWSTSYSVASTMPSGLSFTTSSTQLVFTSTNTIANGTSYQFTPTIKTGSISNWNPSASVKGRG